MRWRGAVREGVPAHRPAVARAPVATQAPGAARTLAPLSCRPPGFWRSGDPLFFATAGAVAVSLILVGGLALLILTKGLGYFWPTELEHFALEGGGDVLGEVVARERTPGSSGGAPAHRIQVKVGNRDLYGLDFRWIDEAQVAARSHPEGAVVLNRFERGDFFGFALRLELDGGRVIEGDALWTEFDAAHRQVLTLRREVHRLERQVVGEINRRIEAARLAMRRIELEGGPRSAEESRRLERLAAQIEAARAEYEAVVEEIGALRARMSGPALVVASVEGIQARIPLAGIVRAYRPNAMSLLQKVGLYAVRVWEFVSGEPRESNTEGGIFPAIFGTVLMVLVMTVAVVPVGVLAAVYLREYATDGWLVSALRVFIRNLAGVPSIVYGVFGMGFFIYFVGGGIDRLFFPERLPAPTFGTGGILWASLTLALLTLPVVIVATEEGLAAVPSSLREASLALGATRFETVWKVVVPGALPGIMTGVILGIARAAGEVAPLMMTGVVKLAPQLAVDGTWPFVHLERKFMHLGFYIYDLGFQSPNVEAARPMLYATALALLVVVFGLNAIAIRLRSKLRARTQSSPV